MSKEEAGDAGAEPTGQEGLKPGGTGENGEIVGGPRTPQQMMAQKRMQQTQAQVDSVVDIMRTNVEKVLERDQHLSKLDERADALQQNAAQFEHAAGALKNKMWWKNMKMMIIMGVIGLVVIIIIAGPYLTGGDKTAAAAAPPMAAVPPAVAGQPVAPAAVQSSGIAPQTAGGAARAASTA